MIKYPIMCLVKYLHEVRMLANHYFVHEMGRHGSPRGDVSFVPVYKNVHLRKKPRGGNFGRFCGSGMGAGLVGVRAGVAIPGGHPRGHRGKIPPATWRTIPPATWPGTFGVGSFFYYILVPFGSFGQLASIPSIPPASPGRASTREGGFLMFLCSDIYVLGGWGLAAGGRGEGGEGAKIPPATWRGRYKRDTTIYI